MAALAAATARCVACSSASPGAAEARSRRRAERGREVLADGTWRGRAQPAGPGAHFPLDVFFFGIGFPEEAALSAAFFFALFAPMIVLLVDALSSRFRSAAKQPYDAVEWLATARRASDLPRLRMLAAVYGTLARALR